MSQAIASLLFAFLFAVKRFWKITITETKQSAKVVARPNEPNPNYPKSGARFWHGMPTIQYLRLLASNGFRVHPLRWAMATLIFIVSLHTSVLILIQKLVWGRKVRETEFDEPPIFVVGHWRSGTTLLHELLSLDDHHTFPSTYECFAPEHFFLTGWWVPRLFWWTVPKERPMDDMAVGFDAPQEDEFALVSMGAPSPYYRMAFCNEPPPYEEFYTLKDAEPKDVARFDESLTYFFKALARQKKKRLILKSPTHTGRVGHLAELFPGSKYIHISRNPSRQILSTMRTWRSLDPGHGFQFPKYSDDELLDFCLKTFRKIYDGFFEQFDELSEKDRYELRFEDLTANPENEIRAIYEHFEFDGVEPQIERVTAYFESRKEYPSRNYEIDPEVNERIRVNCEDYMKRYGYWD